ncbi:MAG: hypothetical protein R3Y36_05415 [Spirochaetales bacterium]
MKKVLFMMCMMLLSMTLWGNDVINYVQNGDFELGDAHNWLIEFSETGVGENSPSYGFSQEPDNTPNQTKKISLYNGMSKDIRFSLKQSIPLSAGTYVASFRIEGGPSGENIKGQLSVNGQATSYNILRGWTNWDNVILKEIEITEDSEVVLEISGTLIPKMWISLDDIALIAASDFVESETGTSVAAKFGGYVNLTTNILMDTLDFNNSVFFSDPAYWDAEANFSVDAGIYGANLAISADRTGELENISFRDTYAWVRLGSLAKIMIGDFSINSANALTDVIDVYDVGILKYAIYSSWQGIEVLPGDALENFLVDFYIGPVTLQLSMLDSLDLAISQPFLHVGTSVSSAVNELIDVSFTAVYQDTDVQEANFDAVRLGSFINFNKIFGNVYALVGYTTNMRPFSNTFAFDHGIDLRVLLPLSLFNISSHNNISLYGYQEMVLYNEVKASKLFLDKLDTSLSLQSIYYSNGETPGDNVYDFNVLVDIDYAIAPKATLGTGLYIYTKIMPTKSFLIGIPLSVEVTF